MTPENQTWGSITGEAPPQVESTPAPPIEATPEPTPLEQPEAPQVEPAPAPAREQETPEQITPKDDYVPEADDPPEIAALPTASAKKWAKRQYQEARPMHTFSSFDKPIQAFGDDLYARSPSRYAEHVKDIVAHQRDDVSQLLYGLPYEDVKARLEKPNGQPVTPLTQPITLHEAELAQMTDAEVAQRFRDATAAKEQEFNAKIDDLKKQFEAVNRKVLTHDEQAQKAEIGRKQDEIYQSVWSVVDEVIRNSGLEAKPDDQPEIASLKEAGRDLLSRHNVEAAFDAIEENTNLVKQVVEATKRREYHNAESEIPNLKVRARAAAVNVKDSGKVQAIIKQIEAFASQSKPSRGANPAPPVPGSAAGIQVKPPANWDEAIAGAAS